MHHFFHEITAQIIQGEGERARKQISRQSQASKPGDVVKSPLSGKSTRITFTLNFSILKDLFKMFLHVSILPTYL